MNAAYKHDLLVGGLELLNLGYELSVAKTDDRGDEGKRPFNPDRSDHKRWQVDTIRDSATLERRLGSRLANGLGLVNVVAVDIDGAGGRANLLRFLDEQGIDRNELRTPMRSATPRGADYQHLIFAPDPEVSNSGGLLGLIENVDVRGTGSNGFLASWPTVRARGGYRWLAGPVPLSELPMPPSWLRGKATRDANGTLSRRSVSTLWKPKITDWGRGSLERLVAKIIDVQAGRGRHQALVESAVAAGHLVVEGDLTCRTAYDALDAAAKEAGLHAEGRGREVDRTIREGLTLAMRSRSQKLADLVEEVAAW